MPYVWRESVFYASTHTHKTNFPLLLLSNYSTDLKQSVQIARSLAKEYRCEQYGAPHLLQAVLHDDIGLSSFLKLAGFDMHRMREWADYRIQKYPRSARPAKEPQPDATVEKVMNVADIVRLKLSADQVDAACVLAALTKPKVGFSEDELKTFPLTEEALLQAFLDQALTPVQGQENGSQATGKTKSPLASGNESSAIDRFCIDLTQKARDGAIDNIVGRNREIRKVAEILGRRTKPNVIIIGEPGVGKTALVEGFAHLIVAGEVPDRLRDASVLELDTGSLIAGAAYKGEIEERLKGILAEIKAEPGRILFIDEIHILLDPQGGAGGAANLLKPELARGQVTVIGATTHAEYRKFIEKDEAFKRRFDVVEVEEPNEEKAVRMLQSLAPAYAEHHGLRLEDEALRESVMLATRYMKDRQLPDAAIDLLDRTAAAVRMMVDTSLDEVDRLETRLNDIVEEFGEGDHDLYLAELHWYENQLRDSVSPILLGKISDLRQAGSIEDTSLLLEYLRDTIGGLREHAGGDKDGIEAADIAAMVAYAKGIPIGKIQADEREKLDSMAEQLNARVIGQEHAVASIASAIKVSRAGIADAGRPVGSFFLLGPTGTGKTELAKALADYLFNDETAMVRFDMSEFTQSNSGELLTGAPPGYVGYEEGGMLVNNIRKQPYSVVLFDEIEKAHPEVFKTFLQVLDDGKLMDKLGKVGDFTNAIILFTSNVGSEYVVESFAKGEVPSQQLLTEKMGQYFKDEFLGRLTEIIPFSPISEEDIISIFRLQVRRLLKSMRLKGIEASLTPDAEKYYAMRGYSPRFGARPLRRVILNDLQKPVSHLIISGELGEGGTLLIEMDDAGEPKFTIS